MRLISRHILRALAAPFFWGVAALTGLMLMQSLPPLIDSFGGRGLPFRIMINGILLFTPTLLALTLPMSVLVSTLYGYSSLASALEMVAMYSNGLSVWRMARPALIAAAIIALANFFLLDQLAPRTYIQFNNLRRAALNTSPTLALQQHVLNQLPAPAGYIIKAERIDPLTSAMKAVTIYDLSQDDVRREIIADSGVMKESENGLDLILTLHTGTIYEFKRDEPGRLQQTNFVHNRIVIRNVQTQFQQVDLRGNRSDQEQSGCELLDAAADQAWSVQYNRNVSEFLTRSDLHAMTGMPPLLHPAARRPVITPHCGVYRHFGNWIKGLMLPTPLAAQQPPVASQQPATSNQQPAASKQQPPTTSPQPPATIQQPAAPPTGLLVPPTSAIVTTQLLTPVIQVELSNGAANDARYNMLHSQVEFHRRVAVSLASFCFVLIGLALALKYPSSGIGLVIGGSLIIFLGFYILLTGGTNAARSGALNPILAMYTPLALFTVIGLFAVHSANQEMGSARSAGVLASIRNLFRRSE
ncbi:MAG TPA: LptF/LptG family permease [Gemmatimonadales bacterium]|jgi:lipopolysaccharide export system permease protein